MIRTLRLQIHSGEHAAGVPGPPYGLWGLYGKQCSTPEGPEPAGHACRPDVGRGRQSPPAGDRFSPGWSRRPSSGQGAQRSLLPVFTVTVEDGVVTAINDGDQVDVSLEVAQQAAQAALEDGRRDGTVSSLRLSPGGCGGRRGPLGLCRPDLGAGKSSGPAADVPAGGAAGAGLFLRHLPAPLHPGLTPRRAAPGSSRSSS